MCNVFAKKDELLMAQGNMTVYFLVFKRLNEKLTTGEITRKKLLEFKKEVKNNRVTAETNLEKANYDLLEFDRMSQQGTNDASSIKERVRILEEYIYKK
jgi:hypothetical protein